MGHDLVTDTARMKLVRPIRFEEHMVTEVAICRQKVGDLRAMEYCESRAPTNSTRASP
jgi:hypothetical protein